MKTQSRGFTLIEVVMALIITSGAIAVVGATWSGNRIRIKKMVQQNRVAFLLERKMTEIKIKYQYSFSRIPKDEKGEFALENKENKTEKYLWEMKSQPFELPNISTFLVAQGAQVDPLVLSFFDQLADFMGQAVKEVSVSVVIQSKGKKEVRYSATSYIVDYTRPFPGLPGMPPPPTDRK